MLTTMNVAIARQTASDFVNSQIARMHSTVHTTKEKVMITKAIPRTKEGLTTPRVFFCLSSTTTSVLGDLCGSIWSELYQIPDRQKPDY